MSAWIVGKGHIDALVQECIVRGLVPMSEASEFGKVIWKENLVSVSVRYPNDADGEWPGPIGLTMADVCSYRFEGVEAELDPRIVAKQAGCWQYQCSEFDGWDERSGARAIATLVDALGVEDAEWTGPWGIEDIAEAILVRVMA